MGLSVVAVAALVVVSICISVEVLSSNLLPSFDDMNDSFSELKKRRVDSVQSALNITDVAVVINGSNFDYNITVENMGSISLKMSDFVVLVNGTSCMFSCSLEYLHARVVDVISVYDVSFDSPVRFKIVTNTGVEAYYEFVG
jgi:archaellum component FlaF (FlaF/FlaG flagellin family)